MNFGLGQRHSSKLLPLLGTALIGACASTVEPVPASGGSGNESGAAGTSGNAGTSGGAGFSGMPGTGATGATGAGSGGAPAGGTGGGVPGSGGTAGTGGAGTGGNSAATKLCATKTPLTTPLITDFESYDGMADAASWGTAFGPGTIYAGPFMVSDETGTPSLLMVGGANASNYALSFSNTEASAWGGALGFWMGCVDASSFQGLSFWLRGAMPTGMITVSLTLEQTSLPDATDPAGGGTCVQSADTDCKGPSATVAITPDWTSMQIPWAEFVGGVGSAGAAVTTNGDGIAGLNFGAQLSGVWTPDPADPTGATGTWTVTPGAVEIVIDDLGFY